nr:hypothetical protein [Proteus mirabilis]
MNRRQLISKLFTGSLASLFGAKAFGYLKEKEMIPNVVVSMPSQLFTLARKFQAVSNGKIFIGKIDTDPTLPENQIQVYLENEDGSHIPVPQPLIINQAGFPVYNGQLAKFVTVEGHSMAVYDSYGAQQFYYPNVLKYDPDQFEKRLSSADGLSYIGSTNYDGVRKYKGNNNKINIFGVENIFDGGSGVYLLDESDNASIDDGGTVIIDALNRRWKRQYLGKVKVEWFGAKADGITDSTVAIQSAINNQMKSPVEMSRGEYCISDTIVIKDFKSLEGVNDAIEGWSEMSSGTVIKWVGNTEARKTMVLLGNNDVGQEPLIGAPAVCMKNIFLNGANKIGFLVYGTYLTRDSIVNNIGGEGSTEYNFYFAKSWYATYTRITSKSCKNNGIAFGMPLIYSDNSRVSWTSGAPLEMNRCKIDNIRSHSAGQIYSVDNPNTYNPKNEAMRMTGYGIGAGVGNSFTLTNFLSEKSGGVNLYYYTETQPVKVVSGGYLEDSCINSGLDPATTLPNIIIDISIGKNTQGGNVISDVFCNYSSGGIYTVSRGNGTKLITLRNLHQPRFLKDIDGVVDLDNPDHPLNFIHLRNVYYQLSYFNLIGRSVAWIQSNINIKNTWSYLVPCSDTSDHFNVFFRNNSQTWNKSGSITFIRPDGYSFSSSYPESAAQGEWVFLRRINNVEKIMKGGVIGDKDQMIDIKIIRLPTSLL